MDVTQFTSQPRRPHFRQTRRDVAGIHPKINLSACRSCSGDGHRVINGVTWSCFVCAGSGTKVADGRTVTACT